MSLHSYLAQDRLLALSRGEDLPDRTTGAALFADISGFTPLTETLTQQLGSRRGLEELTRQVNLVYDALIVPIEQYSGSVITFAGDAITCWFDSREKVPTIRGVTCAFALQFAMQKFPHLGLKVSVATGSARRFLVGDPATHYLDVLAGDTVMRTASGEHLAKSGEVLVDMATVQTLGSALIIKEWRTDDESGERYAVVEQLSVHGNQTFLMSPSLIMDRHSPFTQSLRPFLLPSVFEREVTGQGSFLTEFRPCVILFVRFVGIDYDSNDAQSQLDVLIRRMQEIAAYYEGTLLQLTIGDKGSYVYINFGGLIAHEDDARRAVKAALELRQDSSLQLQIGITQGVMRVGAYGGSTRSTYGALGDEVNLSARLMQMAAPGEILVSGAVQKAVEHGFSFEPHPPLQIKGKAEPLPVFAVTGERQQRAIRLQEPTYALPMVGRKQELRIIEEKLDLVWRGQSQVIGIVAEAGLGKSRLIAEVIRSARKKGFVGYGGACQSDGIYTPYLAWKTIWSAFFDIDPSAPLRKQIRHIEDEIEDRVPSRVEALPLLSTLLGINIPENEFTRGLEPKLRQSALHALLDDCLKAAVKDEPHLVVIEDLHWIDALSHDLLDELAKGLVNHSICFVLAYRPPQLERLQSPWLETLPNFTKIELSELNAMEAEQALRAKLAQLYPARGGSVPAVLVEKLVAHAQGNPFYLEELLNFLHDRGLDPREPSALEKIELPDSLHTLILSRIDRLSERNKTTLRVASIIGRLFRAGWLVGYYPELGELPQVKRGLDELSDLDITPLDTPEPELAYLFKHIITHEVTYESLPFGTRATLHEQLGRFLEAAYPDSPPLETLAFHYGRTANTGKQREYLRKAGEAAQKTFANDAALAYYGQLLPLLEEGKEKIDITLQCGIVLQIMGAWAEADVNYHLALEMAQSRRDTSAMAEAQFALGKLSRLRGDYVTAMEWLAQAKMGRISNGDQVGLGQILNETGAVFQRQGKYEQAREMLNQSLALAREAGNKPGTALVLIILGHVAYHQGDYPAAKSLYEESLTLQRESGDQLGISASLNSLGAIALAQGDYQLALSLYEANLALHREIGYKMGISESLNNLGLLLLAQGDNHKAQELFEESLALDRQMGDKGGVATTLCNLGLVTFAQGDYPSAREILEESLRLRREMNDKWGTANSLSNLGLVALAQGDTTAARALEEESLTLCREIGDKSMMAYALLDLGLVGVAQGRSDILAEAREHIIASLRLRQELGERYQVTSSLVGMAWLALQTGSPRRAALLLGAVDATLKALHASVEPDVLSFQSKTQAAAYAVLGEAEFRSAWETGENLSLEEAVKLAEGDND